MKKLIFVLVAMVVFSCGKKEANQTITISDTISEQIVDKPLVGSDEDAHGCKTSAGYTWSVLKNECVRIFEAGTRLDPYETKPEDAVMAAFVIFDGDQAEVFMQSEKPMVLTRKSEGDSFVNGDWQLMPWKGYVLKKGAKIMFTGQ